jgi:hypothetical protein
MMPSQPVSTDWDVIYDLVYQLSASIRERW